jgi:hypothetical protein
METRQYELSAPNATSFRQLGPPDGAKLRAFFVSLDFDQRRSYFGGALSDQAITEFCEAVDWNRMAIVACSTPNCLEAIAFISYIRPSCETAELAMACSLNCDRSTTVGDLFDLVTAMAPAHCELIIHREFAMPELIHLALERSIGEIAVDEIKIRPRELALRRAH